MQACCREQYNTRADPPRTRAARRPGRCRLAVRFSPLSHPPGSYTMKRMRRLTLHIEHRQITLAVTPTPRANTRPSAEENNRSHGSSSPVPPGCPMCGGSWDFVIAQPSDQTPASAQALQSMLRNAGIPRTENSASVASPFSYSRRRSHEPRV